MSPQRIAVFLLVMLFILFGISLAATFSLLPEKVATHFDITGLPDGWMSRTSHLIFIGLFGIGFPLLIIGICWSVRYVSPVTINIPHRDYWLAEERRLESVDFVFRHSIWLGCLGIAFITGLHWAVVLANRQQPRALPLNAADRMPTAVEEEDAAPGGKAVGHQGRIVPEQITPAEAGALEQVDLAHQQGQRSAQLMRHVLAEAALLAQCLVQPFQRAVHRRDQRPR